MFTYYKINKLIITYENGIVQVSRRHLFLSVMFFAVEKTDARIPRYILASTATMGNCALLSDPAPLIPADQSLSISGTAGYYMYIN